MFRFSHRSKQNLNTLHPALQEVCKIALDFGVMDFTIIEGHRTLERQKQLHAEGKSHLDGVVRKSKHQSSPSLAVDVMPYPPVVNDINVWQDKQRFAVLAGLMHAAAATVGVKLRWGGDWDGDGNNADSSFHDLPHFELLEVGQ